MNLTIREEQVTIAGKVSLGATISYIGKDNKSPAVVLITFPSVSLCPPCPEVSGNG